MTTVRLFVVDEGGETFAYPLARFAELGLATEEAVSAAYEGAGEWHTVTIRPVTAGMDRDAKRAAREFHEDRGFSIDLLALPRHRAAVAVQSWTFRDRDGEAIPVSAEGFDALPLAVAAILDGELGRLFSGATADPRFFALLSARLASSGQDTATSNG